MESSVGPSCRRRARIWSAVILCATDWQARNVVRESSAIPDSIMSSDLKLEVPDLGIIAKDAGATIVHERARLALPVRSSMLAFG